MLQFGCCCKAEHIPQLARAGYDYAELSAAQIAAMPQAQFEAVVAALEAAGLPCLALNDYCEGEPAIVGDGFCEADVFAYAKRVCARAARLGARVIGVGAPMARKLPAAYDPALAVSQAVRFLQLTADAAAQYPGLSILMEALNHTACDFCNTQAASLSLVRQATRDSVFMEVDFFHMACMQEPFESFSTYAPYTKHVHISGKTAQNARRYFTEADEPLCDAALRALRQAGYAGAVSVEAPLSTLTGDALSLSLRHMRRAAE